MKSNSIQPIIKTKLPSLFFVLALLLGIAWMPHAQSYSIDWHKIAGGTSTSTGGPVTGTNYYSVSGTLGQPDAGATMSGGNNSLTC